MCKTPRVILRRFPVTTETFAPSEERDALRASVPGCHCQVFAATKLPRETSGACLVFSKVGVKIHPVFAAFAGIEPETKNVVAAKKLNPFMARLLANSLLVFIEP
jgi:hypothetical protein